MFPSDLFNIWKYFKISCRIISFFLSLQPGLIVIVKSKKVVVHYRSMRAILPLIIPGPQCRMSPGKDLHKIAVIQHFVQVPPGPVTSHQQYCRATLQHKQTRPEAHWMLQCCSQDAKFAVKIWKTIWFILTLWHHIIYFIIHYCLQLLYTFLRSHYQR